MNKAQIKADHDTSIKFSYFHISTFSNFQILHSVRNDFTGFAMAALIV